MIPSPQTFLYWPYFKDAPSAFDGSHIHSMLPGHEHPAYKNHKGFLSLNCLFACSFGLKFVFAYTGWEGSATDSQVYEGVCFNGLVIPEGKYYLENAGYPCCEEILVPYCGKQYHLAEWAPADVGWLSTDSYSEAKEWEWDGPVFQYAYQFLCYSLTKYHSIQYKSVFHF